MDSHSAPDRRRREIVVTDVKKTIQKSPVCRITVDEALDESHLRLLVAPPAKNVRDVSLDDTGCWQDEMEVIVTQKDVPGLLGLRGEKLVSAALEISGVKPEKAGAARTFWLGLEDLTRKIPSTI